MEAQTATAGVASMGCDQRLMGATSATATAVHGGRETRSHSGPASPLAAERRMPLIGLVRCDGGSVE